MLITTVTADGVLLPSVPVIIKRVPLFVLKNYLNVCFHFSSADVDHKKNQARLYVIQSYLDLYSCMSATYLHPSSSSGNGTKELLVYHNINFLTRLFWQTTFNEVPDRVWITQDKLIYNFNEQNV